MLVKLNNKIFTLLINLISDELYVYFYFRVRIFYAKLEVCTNS